MKSKVEAVVWVSRDVTNGSNSHENVAILVTLTICVRVITSQLRIGKPDRTGQERIDDRGLAVNVWLGQVTRLPKSTQQRVLLFDITPKQVFIHNPIPLYIIRGKRAHSQAAA